MLLNHHVPCAQSNELKNGLTKFKCARNFNHPNFKNLKMFEIFSLPFIEPVAIFWAKMTLKPVFIIQKTKRRIQKNSSNPLEVQKTRHTREKILKNGEKSKTCFVFFCRQTLVVPGSFMIHVFVTTNQTAFYNDYAKMSTMRDDEQCFRLCARRFLFLTNVIFVVVH